MANSLQQHSYLPTVESMDLSTDLDSAQTQFMVEETRKLFQHQGSDAELLQRLRAVIDSMKHLEQKPTP